MTYLTRGTGKAGDRQQANASREPTPVSCAYQYRSGGDGMCRRKTRDGSFETNSTQTKAAHEHA